MEYRVKEIESKNYFKRVAQRKILGMWTRWFTMTRLHIPNNSDVKQEQVINEFET